MSRLVALATLCLLLSGCVYYPPYGYAPPPRYRYAPPTYGYQAPPPYPYAQPYAQPYTGPYAPRMPQTLGPNGDTSGATGS